MPFLPFLLLLSRCGGRLELILICLGSLVFLQMALPLVGQVVVVGVAVVVGVILVVFLGCDPSKLVCAPPPHLQFFFLQTPPPPSPPSLLPCCT
jgi:hypothetical protein